MKRLNSEVVGSLFWIAVGVFFAWGALEMNVGTLRKIGSGFLPAVMAAILIIFGLFTLVRGMIRPFSSLSRISWKPHVLIVVSVFFYGFLVNIIGFLPSTFILMLILFGLSIMGERKWARVFLCSAITALASWLLFSVVLGVPFPSPQLIAILR
jgi:hypothetical protein